MLKRAFLLSLPMMAVLGTSAMAGGSADHKPMTAATLNRASAAALSKSSSVSNSTVNVTNTAAPAGGGSGSGRRGGDGYRGAAQPSALGGLSSGLCSGVSGGITVATPMVGVGIQGGGIDKGCERRNDALVVLQLGDVELARAMMDDSPFVQDAKKRLGR